MADGMQAIAPKRTNAVDRVIGAKVQARRIEIGVSEAQVAAALGVTVEQLQKFERGTARIAASQLLTVSQTLATPITALLPNSERSADASARPVDAITSDILRICQSLTPKGRKLLLQFAGVLTPTYAAVSADKREPS